MALSDADIAALANVINGIGYPSGIRVTASMLAAEVRESAAESDAVRKLIIEHYDQDEIAKNPDDEKIMGEMAERPYDLHDLAERIAALSDADAMAAYVKARELMDSAP